MSNATFNTLHDAYPIYIRYGMVYTKICGPDKYISVILQPGHAAASIATGTNPATATPFITADHGSNESEFMYAYNKAKELINL